LGDALLGEGETALAVDLLRRDQPLVLEQLERRVDRARARAPDAAAAGLELLDHLVAVHRTLAKERQHGGADVAAPRPRTAATMTSEELERERPPRASPVVMPAEIGSFLGPHAEHQRL